ncbi:MAG: diaminopimelate epimerase, partial [Limisphaerales bacterium]
MTLEFTKMNGAGNDFVLMDNRAQKISLTPEQAEKICDRHRGVGADGVILLIPCASKKADWAWDFFNSDGSKAEMCGNGARCFARFIQRVTASKRSEISFETVAGIVTAHFHGERVTIDLTEAQDMRLHQQVQLKNGCATIHFINTGVPHAVLFVENADAAMVPSLGPEIRHHKDFAPRGTNVNFVQLLGKNFIRVRTYERGVENETLACGTGVTASALVAAQLHQFTSPVQVQVQGGDLVEVTFEKMGTEFTNVR